MGTRRERGALEPPAGSTGKTARVPTEVSNVNAIVANRGTNFPILRTFLDGGRRKGSTLCPILAQPRRYINSCRATQEAGRLVGEEDKYAGALGDLREF